MKNTYNSRTAWTAGLALLALAAATPLASAQMSLTTVVDLAQKHSPAVRRAQAELQKAGAAAAESRDAYIPSLSFGSGLPAFPEVGFTGNLPTVWDAAVQSLVFSMPQFRTIQAARLAQKAAQLQWKDAREQVALEASSAYIEMDTVQRELEAAQEQEAEAGRLVAIEQQRAEAGVDPLSELLQARLAAAEIKLNRLHLETRAGTLASQLAALTGLPVGSITTDHGSIPEIPQVRAEITPRTTLGIQSAQLLAQSKARLARGDEERAWYPQISFGALYNRNTTLLNSINDYYKNPLPANNFSSGFTIHVPLFDLDSRDRGRASAAEALRARVETEEAQRQNDIAIATLTGQLRELDALAEIASLKAQIAAEQLKTVHTQLELGSGGGSGPGASQQLNPKTEQQALIDERQKYVDALDAGLDLSKARLNLLRALGHMQDWLDELHAK